METRGPQSQAAMIQAEADRLVTVALYDPPHEAHLARLRLEAEGIECVLEGEHAGGLAWPPALGVRLRVRAWQEAPARRALARGPLRPSSADWLTADLEAPRCPRCGSLRVGPSRFSAAGRAARWLVLGLPLPFARARAACRQCGHRWTRA